MSFEDFIVEETVFRLGGKKTQVSSYGHKLSLEVGGKSKFRSAKTVFLTSAVESYELTAAEAIELGQQLVALGTKLAKEKATEPVPAAQPGRSTLSASRPKKTKPKK